MNNESQGSDGSRESNNDSQGSDGSSKSLFDALVAFEALAVAECESHLTTLKNITASLLPNENLDEFAAFMIKVIASPWVMQVSTRPCIYTMGGHISPWAVRNALACHPCLNPCRSQSRSHSGLHAEDTNTTMDTRDAHVVR
jgi:hypothetical protein